MRFLQGVFDSHPEPLVFGATKREWDLMKAAGLLAFEGYDEEAERLRRKAGYSIPEEALESD